MPTGGPVADHSGFFFCQAQGVDFPDREAVDFLAIFVKGRGLLKPSWKLASTGAGDDVRGTFTLIEHGPVGVAEG